MTPVSRRNVLQGCCAAAMASALGPRAWAAPDAVNEDVLVYVFLRGGVDGLNLVSPGAGHPDRGHYEQARADIHIPTSGSGASLPLGSSNFAMHPGAPQLQQLFASNRLAIIQAAGMPTAVTRSHFDAQAYLELGTPGLQGGGTGWITRHLLSATNLPAEITIPALAAASATPKSLLGSTEALTMAAVADFRLDTAHWSWSDAQVAAVAGVTHPGEGLWGGGTVLDAAGRRALDALAIVKAENFGAYTPANGAVYPNNTFGNQLKMIAQVIKADLGVRMATLDLGGWDTHDGQDYTFNIQVDILARGLSAFYLDLDGGTAPDINRVTIVVHSEFGRRLRENDDGGTDHGHGNLMMVLGGRVFGGQVYGQWPGLDRNAGQLFDNADLRVTTDFRRVLSEILIRRLGNPNLGFVFPGYTGYAPLGFVDGTDLPPIYGAQDHIFGDGFEAAV
jgi:uncharacterized protein (DUF1501 family)